MTAQKALANGPKALADPATPSAASAKKSRCHTPGGTALGKDNSREAQRVAAAILEVLAGVRTPGQAAAALGVSMPRYYHWEGRALRGLLASCEARPRGRVQSADKELATLQRQHERLQRELSRQQTLVRLAQRSMGLTPPPTAAAAAKAGKKRRRRPVVRALAAVRHLQQQSQETPEAAVPPAQDTAG